MTYADGHKRFKFFFFKHKSSFALFKQTTGQSGGKNKTKTFPTKQKKLSVIMKIYKIKMHYYYSFEWDNSWTTDMLTNTEEEKQQQKASDNELSNQ